MPKDCLLHYVRYAVIVISLFGAAYAGAYKPDVGHDKIGRFANELIKRCGLNAALTKPQLTQFLEASSGLDHGSVPLNEPTPDNPFTFYKRITHWHFSSHVNFPNGRQRGIIRDSFDETWQTLKHHYHLNNTDQLRYLGGLAHFVEDMANPAHMVPVFHMLGIEDGIDSFAPSYNDIQKRIASGALCHQVKPQVDSLDAILKSIIQVTQANLDEPIPYCGEMTWQAFFTPPSEKKFYGAFAQVNKEVLGLPAHKFRVKRTKPFHIGDEGTLTNEHGQCVFSKDDARYLQFIDQLYISAILADVQLIQWHGRHHQD